MTTAIKKSFKEKVGLLWKDMQKDPEYYNDWERKFVHSLSCIQYEPTMKQEAHLEAIWEKHLKR